MAYKHKPLPSSVCNWEYSATSRIRQALGFEHSKIPATFHGRFKVDGWSIVVKRGKKQGKGYKSAAHRIFVDHGGRLIPAGRMRQAACPSTKLRLRRSIARAAAKRR